MEPDNDNDQVVGALTESVLEGDLPEVRRLARIVLLLDDEGAP